MSRNFAKFLTCVRDFIQRFLTSSRAERGTKQNLSCHMPHATCHICTRGVTLIELLLVSVLSLVAILAIGHVDVTRVRLTQPIRQTTLNRSEAVPVLAQMAKLLRQADRINLLGADNVQVRIPQDRDNLDLAGSYRWTQYRYDSGTKAIRFYDPASSCTVLLTFRDIGSLAIQYQDESPVPPGGEPPVLPSGADNNVLGLTVTSTTAETVIGEVTIRAGAYTNLMTGLAPPGVSDPPTPCTS